MSFMHKFAMTVTLATVGAILGYGYARLTLPEHVQSSRALVAMYTSFGAAFMILGARLGQVLVMVFREWRAKKR